MFLIRPDPFTNESLSSWRQRSGIANGFWRFPLNNIKRSITDLDRFQLEGDRNWLTEQFAINSSHLEKMTLDHAIKPIVSERIELSKNHWLLPIGYKSKPTTSGPVYCALCLATDHEPYFRLAWRLAFLTYCPIHGIPLRDRCRICNSVVWPSSCLLISVKWMNLRHCQNCGGDLSKGIELQNDQLCHEVSGALWKIYCDQSFILSEVGVVHSQEYFMALWSMCQIIMRSRSHQIQQYIPLLQSYQPYVPENLATTISLVPLSIRGRVIAAAVWLLQDWPYNFQKAISQAKITGGCLRRTKEARPNWMSEVINKF